MFQCYACFFLNLFIFYRRLLRTDLLWTHSVSRYIRWTEQAFPGGGKDGNLAAVLERAVQALHGHQQYYKDPRYLNLWLKFVSVLGTPLGCCFSLGPFPVVCTQLSWFWWQESNSVVQQVQYRMYFSANVILEFCFAFPDCFLGLFTLDSCKL